MKTDLGDIVIALETERAPVTAANFLRYADEKRFDGTCSTARCGSTGTSSPTA
jgi:cyclophilin family peptidyl-prolyl cis-trans isomerase